MTGRRRASPPPAPLPSQRAGAAPDGKWLARNTPAADPGVVWVILPMPRNHWPIPTHLPRDNSFSWLVRSACGHDGGVKQWAFYDLKYAQIYEQVFRTDPCRWTRCPDRIMIENKRASRG